MKSGLFAPIVRIPPCSTPKVTTSLGHKAAWGCLGRLFFPRKGPLHAHPQCMDGFVEEAFASALGSLSVARILCDVGDQARLEDQLPVVRGIKAPIEVDIGSFQVQ